ncbi:MAG: redoxin domain-containing protein [Dehalococcoidia bacterium]|nr:redoxin domain-containing protein [Dehalococcoidia bacterium]
MSLLPAKPPTNFHQETGRNMSEVGQMAPDFTLPAHNGEPVTLSDFRGKKNVVLSFHIFSFTGG